MKVPVGISARHIHLTEETYNKLFAEPLTVKTMLNQPGQFAANNVLTIKTENGSFENVRIVGPLREYNQVEISRSDARVLGLNPPVRRSGDIVGSEAVTLIGPKGEVFLNEGVIIANRHVHFTAEEAGNLGLVDDQTIKLNISGEKAGTIMAKAVIRDKSFCEAHLDVDDANAFLLNQGDEVELIL